MAGSCSPTPRPLMEPEGIGTSLQGLKTSLGSSLEPFVGFLPSDHALSPAVMRDPSSVPHLPPGPTIMFSRSTATLPSSRP
ncbi:hypothetical protein T484DRAFT_1785438 [Baffinella frigidus]|nr:hypothetical protein T484DRAFT_1785438 [Cryptophyta sp. CCMP2293]